MRCTRETLGGCSMRDAVLRRRWMSCTIDHVRPWLCFRMYLVRLGWDWVGCVAWGIFRGMRGLVCKVRSARDECLGYGGTGTYTNLQLSFGVRTCLRCTFAQLRDSWEISCSCSPALTKCGWSSPRNAGECTEPTKTNDATLPPYFLLGAEYAP